MKQVALHMVLGPILLQYGSKLVLSLSTTRTLFHRRDVICKLPSSHLLLIYTVNISKDIGATEKIVWKSDTLLVFFDGCGWLGSRRNRVDHDIYLLRCKQEHTLSIINCSAEVHYWHHWHNKKRVATHDAGHIICKIVPLGHFCFKQWAAALSLDAPLQLKSPNTNENSSILKDTQRLKAMPAIFKNHGQNFIENASNCP